MSATSKANPAAVKFPSLESSETATALSLRTQPATADTAPSSSAPLPPRLRAGVAACAAAVAALEERFARWCRNALGPFEFSESVYVRGHLGLDAVCRICRQDVHDAGEMCPKQWSAQCDVCGLTLVDYYGHCLTPRSAALGHHIIDKTRHATTPEEWRRLRFTVYAGGRSQNRNPRPRPD